MTLTSLKSSCFFFVTPVMAASETPVAIYQIYSINNRNWMRKLQAIDAVNPAPLNRKRKRKSKAQVRLHRSRRWKAKFPDCLRRTQKTIILEIENRVVYMRLHVRHAVFSRLFLLIFLFDRFYFATSPSPSTSFCSRTFFQSGRPVKYPSATYSDQASARWQFATTDKFQLPVSF